VELHSDGATVNDRLGRQQVGFMDRFRNLQHPDADFETARHGERIPRLSQIPTLGERKVLQLAEGWAQQLETSQRK